MIKEYEPEAIRDPLRIVDGKWNYNHRLYQEMTFNERLTLLERVFDLNGRPAPKTELPNRTDQWKLHLKSYNHKFKVPIH